MTIRAASYARVSTEDQATDDKTSLAEQLRGNRLYAEANAMTIVEEIAEDISGRKRTTPGLDRIRDMAEAGLIDVVIVYKWNRLARKATKQDLFIMEMKMAGVDVVSLDGQSNKTHAGRAMNRMMAVFSEYQRDDLVETMRGGKLGQARKGRIMPGRFAPYGFVYDPDMGNYRVDESRMAHVRRAFKMVGIEGRSMRSVRDAFQREGVPTPGGGPFWPAGTIREIIRNDVYKSHTPEELQSLVDSGNLSPEVLAGLDPDQSYGIAWYNRTRWEHDADHGDKKHHVTANDRSEHIAVPVPDAGVPREWLDAARHAISGNVKRPRIIGDERELEGLVYCPCGSRMYLSRQKGRHFYYQCNRYRNYGKQACEHGKTWRADKLEQEVRRSVIGELANSGGLVAKIRGWAEAERRALRRPDKEAFIWQQQIADLDRKIEGYWDLAASGDMPKDRMRAKVAEAESQQDECQRELERALNRQDRLKEVSDLIVILGDDDLWLPWVERAEDDPSGYRKLLQRLKLRIVKHKDGKMELTGDYDGIVNTNCGSPRCMGAGTIS
jgi:site-specific DNA recombinase